MILPHEEFTYGKANRPSTPVKAVVGGFYGAVAEKETLTRYEIIKAQSKPVPLLMARNHTQSSQLFKTYVKSQAIEEEMRASKVLFKMTKFRNVGPRTNSFNNGTGGIIMRSTSYATLQAAPKRDVGSQK